MKKLDINAFITVFIITILISNVCAQDSKSVFSKQNITPWCIVPFDTLQRNPEQRAQMLQKMGFKTLAYDWRKEHISQFDQEISQLRKHEIEMTAFWWQGGLPKSKEQMDQSEIMQAQLDFLRRNNLKLEVWVSFSDWGFEDKSDKDKVTLLARRADILATKLGELGCRISLYNHGGWGGNPNHMLGIIKKMKYDKVGIVYNFHHSHDQLDQVSTSFQRMLPYLTCVNLSGVTRNGPKILTLGEGEEDVAIIKMIKESGYSGPIGILGHVASEDVELVLTRNLNGLKKLLRAIGDTGALETY
jgi:sugar phosphate isomerase/epimerase